MDLVLGTAQLGIKNYGINNHSALSEDQIEKIFHLAKKNKVKYLDTSDLYGSALKRIQNINDPFFSLILKLNFQNHQDLERKLNDIMKENNSFILDSILFHNHSEILENNNLWNQLYQRKSNFNVEKVGVSIYKTKELEDLYNSNIIPDVIEIPYNIIDTEFSTLLKEIKSQGTEIIVRSVFLQGLLFMEPENIPEKLKEFKKILFKINKLLRKYTERPNRLLLDFIKQNPYIDKLIIGIDSEEQLQDNINAFNAPIHQSLLDEFEKLDLDIREELKKINNWKNL